jgi:hypothetical protein
VLKSTHFALSLLVLPLLFLALVSGTALAQGSVWVDTVHKTAVAAFTAVLNDDGVCTFYGTGSFTVTTAPTHGELFFDVEYFSGFESCKGLYPLAVARYTWTDSNESVLQDPFTLVWSFDGAYKQSIPFSIIGELAKITTSPKSIWWVCGVSGGSLRDTGKLTLENPPSAGVLGSTPFLWTITAGATELVYSNGKATKETTGPWAGVKTLAASAALNDISANVVVLINQEVSSGEGVLIAGYREYKATGTVRTPKQLKRRPDLDHDYGVGTACEYPPSGTDGFLSLIGYEVDDQFGVNTFSQGQSDAGVNEYLGAKKDYQTNNWSVPTAGGATTPGGVFVDRLCFTGAWTPHPLPPQSPLTNNLVDTIPQTWYAGSSATPPPNQGCEVQTDKIYFFIDHGRHRAIKSPVSGADFAAAVSAAGGGTAYPTPVLNVRYLAEQSGVIVKGRVLKVNETGTIEKPRGNGLLTFHEMAASFQVDSVLKGNVEAKVITVGFLENPEVLALTLEPNEYALLFLNSGQDGKYSFADPQVGKMAITSQNVPLAETAQTTEGKLEAELMASLSDPDSEVARTALEQVGNLGSVRSTQAIRNIASAGAPDFQGLAHRALLRLGDYSLLDQAIRYAEEPAQELDLQRLQLGVVEAIGDIENRSAVPALNSLLASPSVNLRRAAAKALRAIGDPSSARFLVRALDDSDRDVQYDAGMALAGLAGATPDNAPSRAVFDRSPAKYLGRWKSWWETSGKQGYRSSH